MDLREDKEDRKNEEGMDEKELWERRREGRAGEKAER